MKVFGFKRGNDIMICHRFDTEVRLWVDATKHEGEGVVNILVYNDRKEAEKYARKIGAEIFEIEA